MQEAHEVASPIKICSGLTFGNDEPSKQESHEHQQESCDVGEHQGSGQACNGSELCHADSVTQEANAEEQEKSAAWGCGETKPRMLQMMSFSCSERLLGSLGRSRRQYNLQKMPLQCVQPVN